MWEVLLCGTRYLTGEDDYVGAGVREAKQLNLCNEIRRGKRKRR